MSRLFLWMRQCSMTVSP